VTALDERLRDVDVPDSGAAERRAWDVVERAYRQRPRSRRLAVVPSAIAVALAGIAVGIAVTSPGAAVADWVGRVLGIAAPPAPRPAARATLGPLPAGRLLVSAGGHAFVVDARGRRTDLGAWTGASWSPRGLFVVVWRGRTLAALTPTGRVAWRFVAGGRVRDTRWSPDGFRIAFRADNRLAVIAGDGTGARVLAPSVLPIAPAWRPRAAHELAWVGSSGRLHVLDVDTARRGGRVTRGLPDARALAWAADGRRLLVRSGKRFLLADPRGGRTRPLGLPSGHRATLAAWSPIAPRVMAVVARTPERLTEVRVLRPAHGGRRTGRRVFATTGRLGSLAWSPDGRRLLVLWTAGDQWLVLPAGGRRRVVAVAAVSRFFGGPPLVEGWCCTPRRP
jgi:hypothetical protein